MMKIYLFQSVLIPLTNSVETSYSLPKDEICTFQLNKGDSFNKIIAHKQLFVWREGWRGKWKESLPTPF